MQRRIWRIAIAATVIAACQEPATVMTSSGEEPVSLQSEANGVVASTTGEGKSELPPSFGQADFAFNAILNADGTAKGEFRMFRLRNGLTSDFAGEVTCVSFDPLMHHAWIGGVVTRNSSTDPNQQLAAHQPGQDIWFRVADNGERSADAPDRATVMGFVPGPQNIQSSAEYCSTKPWPENDANTFPVVEGNIQVRP